MRFLLMCLTAMIVGSAALADPVGDANTAVPRFSRNLVIALFNNTTDSRKRLAYLVTDENAKPLIYPSPRTDPQTHQPNDLRSMSLSQVQRLWGRGAEVGDLYQFEFVGYLKDSWGHFKLDIKAEDGICRWFRVLGPGLTSENWLLAMSIPSDSEVNAARDSYGKLRLPPWIGCVEGPFDTSRCGYDPP